MFPHFWYIIVALLPFRYPMKTIYYTLAVYSVINARGLGIFHLRLFPPLSTHIVFARFLLFPIFSPQKILFVYILVRTLCGTCNSISYVLYFLWRYLIHSFNCPPILFFVVTARSQPYYTKSEFLCLLLIGKPLPNHATMAWFYYTIKKPCEMQGFFVEKRQLPILPAVNCKYFRRKRA